MKIFLCGDVMTGRGVDQILPYPCDPKIYEPFVKDARDYVKFAEEINGKIDYPVSFDYIWGDALKEIEKEKVDLRIINLETTITTSENFEPKGINYRMNPKNINVLKVFKVNVACLANNHILDFGQNGLLETIEVLNKNGILTVGAGKNIEEDETPIIFGRRTSKILIFNYADVSSGVPIWWKAEKDKAGVNLLTSDVPKLIAKYLDPACRQGWVVRPNIVIFSIHWGPNWGYKIEEEQRNFAHRLIDEFNVDLIFGHSSHHFKIKKFRLNYCGQEEIDWIFDVLKRESKIEGDLILEEKRIIIKIK